MKRNKDTNQESYVIAFCDEPDLSTKFGQDHAIYHSKEDAEHAILSKATGWSNAIAMHAENSWNKPEDCWKIDSAWLVIEKIK